MFKTIMLIGAGSFLGGTSRYLISRAVEHGTTTTFPWGTMVVNIIGCLLVGLIYGLFERGSIGGQDLKMFLTVGFCGGFTTFSTFIHENYIFLNDRNFLYFLLYAVGSFALGLTAAYLGHLIIKAF